MMHDARWGAAGLNAASGSLSCDEFGESPDVWGFGWRPASMRDGKASRGLDCLTLTWSCSLVQRPVLLFLVCAKPGPAGERLTPCETHG